ncbi:MAG: hypothetical protein HY752_05445 [Nitrospirae bacterium]|nr:hypothetical protein [Nitrospirota bacterium]
MGFDIDKTLNEMAKAIGAIFTGEWPKVKDCVENVLKDERKALADIAKARLSDNINDDELKSQLEDEQATLEAALLVCGLKAKAMVQKAINAALKVFEDAVKTAIKAM